MADGNTTFWGLTKPEVGASRDSWGSKLNANMDLIDLLLAAACPIGSMFDFAGTDAPYGWVLCDGRLLTVALYPRLFAVINNRWGGDGVANFAVPDSRGRGLVGVGQTIDETGAVVNRALTDKGGAIARLIMQLHLPDYRLPWGNPGTHTHIGATDAQGLHVHSGQTGTGGNHQHTFVALQSQPGIPGAGGSFPGYAAQGAYTDFGGAHVHAFTTDASGVHGHNITLTGGEHDHLVTLGGFGGVFPIASPFLAATKIIYAGADTSHM